MSIQEGQQFESRKFPFEEWWVVSIMIVFGKQHWWMSYCHVWTLKPRGRHGGLWETKSHWLFAFRYNNLVCFIFKKSMWIFSLKEILFIANKFYSNIISDVKVFLQKHCFFGLFLYIMTVKIVIWVELFKVHTVHMWVKFTGLGQKKTILQQTKKLLGC